MERDTDNNGGVTWRRASWRIAGIAVLCVLAVCWFVWGPVGIISYVGGLFNSSSVFVVLFLLTLPTVAGSVAFPLLGVYAAATWRRHSLRHRRALAVWLVLTGGFGCPFILGLGGLTDSEFGIFVRGFTMYAEQRVDVGAIQNWLGTLDPNDYVDPGGVPIMRTLADPEQPAPIAKLRPGRTMLLFDDGKPMVRLSWGSGFVGYRGIAVGPQEMRTPPAGSRLLGDRQFPLSSPGACVWSGE